MQIANQKITLYSVTGCDMKWTKVALNGIDQYAYGVYGICTS